MENTDYNLSSAAFILHMAKWLNRLYRNGAIGQHILFKNIDKFSAYIVQNCDAVANINCSVCGQINHVSSC